MSLIATHDDAKTLGYCNKGLRRWFAMQDVSFDTFRRAGVSVEWLRARDNAMADRLADYVEAKHGQR